MSVQNVTITTAREKFAPPSQEIDISVIDGMVFISVYSGSRDDLTQGRTKTYNVPEIDLKDLICALNAFGVASHGLLEYPLGGPK